MINQSQPRNTKNFSELVNKKKIEFPVRSVLITLPREKHYLGWLQQNYSTQGCRSDYSSLLFPVQWHIPLYPRHQKDTFGNPCSSYYLRNSYCLVQSCWFEPSQYLRKRLMIRRQLIQQQSAEQSLFSFCSFLTNLLKTNNKLLSQSSNSQASIFLLSYSFIQE